MIIRIGKFTCLTAFWLICYGMLSAQPWYDNPAGEKPNFFNMRDAGNLRFEKVKNQKAKGYKAFKRWEQYWQPRVFGDGSFPAPDQTIKAWNDYQLQSTAAPTASTISGSSWTSLGPNSSPGGYNGIGRINRISFHPTNSSILFASTAGGGLWKTTNGGSSWTPLTDQLSTIGTSGLVINPTNTNTMYLASGDADGFDSHSFGVLKSTDGGSTWDTTGLKFSNGGGYVVYNLVMHPTDTTILLAATSNGLYRTDNAGASWTRVITTEGIYEVEFKPGTPSTIYACSRTGVYRSTNTGVNWSKTFVLSGASRLSISVSPANTEFVGAIAAKNSDGGFLGFYGSTDGGGSFSLRTSTPNLLGWATDGSDVGGQGWYDLCLAIAPDNADKIYVGGVNTWRSTDGGYTWTIMTNWYGTGTIPEMHADQHDLAFQSSSTLFAVNDGGLYKSTSGGTSWTELSNGLVISQMYRAAASQKDTKIIAGLQDNGTKLRGTTGTWADHIGGDGMECGIDQSNASYLYGTLYYGQLIRSSDGGNNFTTDITPNGNPDGNWVSPFVIDPTTSSTIYLGLTSLYKSTNRGTSWTSISGTVNGGNALNAIAVAPSNSNVIYMNWSTNIATSTNGGASWTKYTTPANTGTLTSLEVDSTNSNTIYATFSNFNAGNKVYRSTNGGATWTNISGTLPNIPANKIILQRSSPVKAMYVGMDVGVYYRDSTMSDWVLYNSNLPNVEIADLEIRYSDKKLIAATYGRGLWETPLYVPPPPEVTITSFTPTSAGKDSTVSITGTNFTGATSVKFGGTEAASFNVVSSTQITAVVGTGSSGSVSVTTSVGTGSKTGFTFIDAPTITTFTPTSIGKDSTVTITGTNFTGASSVKFGGTEAASFNIVSSTQITAVVGTGSSGSVSITTTGGTGSKTGFTFIDAPTITSFAPTSTGKDSTVTITGTNFNGATSVKFGGTEAASFNIVSSTQITAVVGTGSSGSVSITTIGGTGSKTGFTFIDAPTITSFTPTSTGKDSTVTITGTNFTGATSVKFGGTEAASFNVVSSTQITAVVGTGSSGSVSVTTPGGTGSKTGFTFIDAPTVTSFAPSSTGKDSTVTINGSNFTGATSVKFGGTEAASFNVVSSTQITAVVGTGSSGSVSVTTAGGVASKTGFTFIDAPTITSFTPTSTGKDSTVTINGTNFTGATSVKFGGTEAASFNVVSSTQITAVVGTGGSGSVSITTTGGTGSKTGFTYLDAPTVTSFTPTSTGKDSTVTITGTNFTGATSVKFGGTEAASFNIVSSTQITAVVGTGSSGSVSVTTAGGVASKSGFTFIDAPTITSFAPTSTGKDSTVTITGTNFTGATSVKLGGTEAVSFNVVSSTQITAVVGTGSSGSVSVTTSGGTGSKTGFTFIDAPTVTSFTPTSTGKDSTVTITGTNFTGASSVKFGGTEAASFNVVSSTQITAVVGTGSSGSVSVTTSGGTGTKTGFTFIGGPTITSFTPISTGKDSTATITGTNFTGATSVKFGGTEAASFNVVSSTQITAVVGTGSSGSVSVTTSGGTGSKTGFTFIDAPTITTFTPTSTGKDSTVTITGTNFTGATSVKLGGTEAVSFNVVSSTQITAVVGTGSSGSVSVTTAGGLASKTGFTFIDAPTITSFTPTSTGKDSMVTITGTNFTGASSVKFGGTEAASFNVVSSTQITAVVGTGSSGSVSVTTSGGTGTKTGFTFIGGPTITSFIPTSTGKDSTVTITGTNFTGATSVKFGGTEAASFNLVSSTQITAVVGTGSSGSMSVTTGGGVASKTGFTFIDAPTITSFSPTSAGPGVTVTITGTNLTGASTVSFGSTAAASFSINSATEISAVVGSGSSGNLSIRTPGGLANFSGFTFVVAPTVTVNSGTICQGDSISLTASGADTYTWSPSTGLSATTGSTVKAAPGTTTLYVVTGTKTECNCSDTDTSTVTVTSSATATISITPSTTLVSPATAVTFTANATGGGASPQYQWKMNGQNVGSNSTSYSNNSWNHGDSIVCMLTSNANCISGNPFKSNTVKISVSSGISYCNSNGSTTREYLGRVQIPNVLDSLSGDNGGYGNFQNKFARLQTGSSYTINLTPAWKGAARSEGYAVWIDFNRNGVYTDAGELVYSRAKTTATPITGSFTVPANASTGYAGMRVSMKYNAIPASCDIGIAGEVEDYSVLLVQPTPDITAPTKPANLSASNISSGSLTLNWTASFDSVGVTSYLVYRNGTLFSTVSSNTASITGLSPLTTYSFYVVAKDAAGNSSSQSDSISVTTTNITYCASSATTAGLEYIKVFSLGAFTNNNNLASGYTSYTNLTINAVRGSSNALTITPGWSGAARSEGYRVWIDLNQDGDFADAGEQVFNQSKTTKTSITGTITIPTTASLGATRLRVTMKYNASPTSCESNFSGEVEDYTLNITAVALGGRAVNNLSVAELTEPRLLLYPNPAYGDPTLVLAGFDPGPVTIRVVDIYGRLILNKEYVLGTDHANITVPFSQKAAGLYLVQAIQHGKKSGIRFVKQ